MRGRRWMQLVRLLVACVAFFVARPADAMPSVDRIVVIAERSANRATADRREETAPAPRSTRTTARPARAPALAQLPARVRTDYAPREPLVLVSRKYLRNCSLLC